MNSLSILRNTQRLPYLSLVRSYCLELKSPWFIDNKPGPYPKTEEEKCAAAKKYGLLREEYEPYPDDGNGYGDYPKFEPVNVEEKNPYYTWSDPYYRRNYNEPIHVDFAFYNYGRISAERTKYSRLFMFGMFFLTMGGITFLFTNPYIMDYKYHAPVLEKQFPKSGEIHYTFELVKDYVEDVKSEC